MKNNLKWFAFLGVVGLFLNTSFAQEKPVAAKSETKPQKVENIQPANAENLSNPSNPSEAGKPVLKQVSKPGCSMKCRHGKKEETGCVPGKCQKACCAPKGKAEKVTPGS